MTRDRETARRIAQEVQPLGGSVYLSLIHI